MSNESKAGSSPLVRLCLSSLRVGVLGFGGPLATMSMMRDEIVAREKLVDDS